MSSILNTILKNQYNLYILILILNTFEKPYFKTVGFKSETYFLHLNAYQTNSRFKFHWSCFFSFPWFYSNWKSNSIVTIFMKFNVFE